MKTLSDLKKHQEYFNSKEFGNKILDIIPELKPYVFHRLYIGTSLGIIPANMYVESDIIDEAILQIYKSDLLQFDHPNDLRLELFRLVKVRLDKLFKEESWHQQNISTDKLLHEELNKLKEKFTYNADEDFIMNEELTDISYHQGDFSTPLKLYQDAEHSLISAFDLKQWNEPQKNFFHKMYNFLSMEASNVVDLHVFGKLSSSEIAQIKGVSEPVVRQIILSVKDRISGIVNGLDEEVI